MFTIEKGIPVPKRVGNTGPRCSKYPFSEMSPGDSFFVKAAKSTASTRSSLRASFRRWAKANGSTATIRTAVENDGVRTFLL